MNIINFNKENNLNLIRLVAALQGAFSHSLAHLDIKTEWLLMLNNYFFKYIPGVPIFFFVSGFLIYWSFQRNSSNILQYFKNRLLRIYPALWFSLIVTIFILFVSVTDFKKIVSQSDFLIWLLAQISFFQFYTPDILRFWGTGTPNGALWTIVIELQFYFFIPVIYFLKNKHIYLFFSIFLLSVLSSIYLGSLEKSLLSTKLLGVFLFPWLHYFLLGIILFIYWEKLKKFIENKFIFWLITYLFFNLFFDFYLGINTYSYFISSPINIISDILLLALTFSAATTNNKLGHKLLGNNDISYGVYIYHMIIINTLINFNLIENPIYLIVSLVSTCLLGFLSWKFIEKKALSFKYKKKITSKI
jgi:peptidoglycan/LPS O-acetylase OafA/YrhL